MTTSAELQSRIVKMRQLLKEKQRAEKRREAEQVLNIAKQSGLTLLDLQNLIQAHTKVGG